MKKVTYCLVMLIVFALFSNVVLGAENASFGIGLTSTKTSVNPGDEITVTLNVKDFKNMTEGIYSFLGTIEYDKEFFETLTDSSVKGLGTWSSVPTFNPSNGLITAETGSGVKTQSDVFAITFKVKSTVQAGTSTKIVVKDFEASEGDSDISANAAAAVTINVAEKANDNTNNDNNDNNETNNNNNGTNNGGIKDDTTASKDEKLPQTGENYIIIFAIGTIVFVAICGYVGYKKYSNI